MKEVICYYSKDCAIRKCPHKYPHEKLYFACKPNKCERKIESFCIRKEKKNGSV